MFGFDINIYICFLTLGLVPVIVFRLWYWRPKGKSCKITKCIAVMSRYPIIGKTKTRLIPKLGISGAAVCQLYMTEHLLNTVSDFYKESQDFRVTVHYHGGTEKQVAHWLKQRQINDGLLLSWQQQYGKSLGDRLVNVAKSCFDNGDEHVIITGSDIPSINKDVLSEVFHKLKCKESNIILGQAKDGGYYLIALSRDCREFLDDIFDEIDWGTDKVFQQQVTRIKKVDLSLYIIEQVLSDVDLAEDFPVFEREIGINLIQIKHPTWSIIIPTLNEEKTIVKSISSILKVDKCKKLGHIVTVPQAVVINSRRWKRKGVIRVTLWNQFILMAYRLGVNQQTLAIWYYGEQIKSIIQNSKEH